MRVFVLGTGRCGSVTFSKACQHITNFTSAHETPLRMPAEECEFLHFPDRHIEVNPGLTWVLPCLPPPTGYTRDFFVHLHRPKEEVVASWYRRGLARGKGSGPGRWYRLFSMHDPRKLSDEQWLRVCEECFDWMSSEIIGFLEPESHVVEWMDFPLAEAGEKWPRFWEWIGAEGDYDASLSEWDICYNRG